MSSSQFTSFPFNVEHTISELKHWLPAQSALKDFIHHNTLHAFQHLNFKEGILTASQRLGYKVLLPLDEYRAHYKSGKIRKEILLNLISVRKPNIDALNFLDAMLNQDYGRRQQAIIGSLRAHWKKEYKIDLDSLVHPLLFRVVCAFLDQGISVWSFPLRDLSFKSALLQLEKTSSVSFFRTQEIRSLFISGEYTLTSLLHQLVGSEKFFAQYLFDQQFAHQGWSGFVSTVEDQPWTLLDKKKISLLEFIEFECLLELDALKSQLASQWKPLGAIPELLPPDLFSTAVTDEYFDILYLWHEAFEWSYYDQALGGIQSCHLSEKSNIENSFQAIFCIDDRECSLRRYLEDTDNNCATYSTPGFFGVEFYYKPVGSKFLDKLCPAPVFPKYIIEEKATKAKHKKDPHFSKVSQSFHSGWLISQTLGFWSAIKLFANVFNPKFQPAATSSFKHMDRSAILQIEREEAITDNDLRMGYTAEEMADRVEGTLRCIGLINNFASMIYVVGHGASSVNNPHYSAYDCGACSGRAGSVNARVFAAMANHKNVRTILGERGINIPETTFFMGALHDTTVDHIEFYDRVSLSPERRKAHRLNKSNFDKALEKNAVERARRFLNIRKDGSDAEIHASMKRRAISLFEPRPELNHATNALCIVGRREMTKKLFLDRRAFMNSYDYRTDPDGKYLFQILRPAAPVCGGINLEYFFSRVDNLKMGAGTKLPHNVMGLFGVANGMEGDLRPGLPSQMIEIHDPVRLLIIVEQFPDIVLNVIQRDAATYEWFGNNWVNLVAVQPETREFFTFENGHFKNYKPLFKPEFMKNKSILFRNEVENLPVMLIPD